MELEDWCTKTCIFHGVDEGGANVPGVAMAMHTPLERSPHPHHQPVPLVVCSDQHIGHEDEEEGMESH